MRVFLLMVVLALAPLSARGEAILVNSSHGGIYLVDIETLAVREVAHGPQFFDIAVGPNGEILGVTGSGQLWRVEPDGLNLPLGFLRVFVNALAFDAGGTLVGAGYAKVVGISPVDGVTRLVGTYPGFSSSGDMAFGPDGVLFATSSPGSGDLDTLFRLVPGGAMQAVGPIGFRNVYGMVWSVEHSTLIGLTEARELIVIDSASGAGRLLGMVEIPGRGYGAAGFGAGPAVIGSLTGGLPSAR